MTTKELIEKLETENPDAIVLIKSYAPIREPHGIDDVQIREVNYENNQYLILNTGL